MTYKAMNELEKAEEDYTELLNLSGGSAERYNDRAVFYLEHLKDYEKALADLNMSLELEPNQYYRYYQLALTALVTNDLSACRAA